MVREFTVRVGCEKDFALIFGPEGVWSKLVQSCADGYAGSELIAVEPHCYSVRDYWRSHWEFEAFRRRCQDQIELFRKWVAAKELIEHEELLGLFYLDEHGFDEGTGLVSA